MVDADARRILFVDDDPFVLKGLERMLWGMRREWTMVFVQGGRQALEVMGKEPFQVIVSDMRMPGMNGAQLLGIVASEYPDTIRIVLSGYADQELVTQCLGTSHQFLSKPCDPEFLKGMLSEAFQLWQDVSCGRIRRLVGSIDRLPSRPALFEQLSRALCREETSAAELGRIISQDMGMTAKILKLGNSAFFGLHRDLSSPAEAVAYLGIETIRSLVLAGGLFEAISSLETQRLDLADIWQHSLSVGHHAREVMKRLHGNGNDLNRAFTGGLLQDVGILVLARAFPEAYDWILGRVAEGREELSAAERRILGADHAEVGANLMALWGLPLAVVESVRYHHQPSAGPQSLEGPSPLCAVHMADLHCAKRSSHPIFNRARLDPALAGTPWYERAVSGDLGLTPSPAP